MHLTVPGFQVRECLALKLIRRLTSVGVIGALDPTTIANRKAGTKGQSIDAGGANYSCGSGVLGVGVDIGGTSTGGGSVVIVTV
jgi:hypothetical protein